MALTTISTLHDYEDVNERLREIEAVTFPAKILEMADSSWEAVRTKRNLLLKASDWVMTPDCTVDQAQWAAYRQALRDLPQTYSSGRLEDIEWPSQPSLNTGSN
jgi:hypothetical protein|tara:strand:- start:148 stop:459 length:312 start_codon:yes stop_codon:yes gene_type:complete